MKTYFIVNDTRYDNHHGCLTVINNLMAAMTARNWQCIGSLPVSSSTKQIGNYFPKHQQPDLIIVNGEGTLHHNGKNCRKLLKVCAEFQKNYPVVLINAVWQEVNTEEWLGVIKGFKHIFTRDQRSQQALLNIRADVRYVPDLTFYQYPEHKPTTQTKHLAITDSVLNAWSEQAYAKAINNNKLDLVTLFTGEFPFKRGLKDQLKAIKSALYPILWQYFKLPVPPRYKALTQVHHANTELFIKELNSYQGICVARYHAMCFAIQQNIPFVYVKSNSYKSEALAAEVGLPIEHYELAKTDIDQVEQKLNQVIALHPQYQQQVQDFCQTAKQRINEMFDIICQQNG